MENDIGGQYGSMIEIVLLEESSDFSDLEYDLSNLDGIKSKTLLN